MAASLRGREDGSRERKLLKKLSSNALKTVAKNTSICVIVICKMYSLFVR
jgi:hypothetical protein